APRAVSRTRSAMVPPSRVTLRAKSVWKPPRTKTGGALDPFMVRGYHPGTMTEPSGGDGAAPGRYGYSCVTWNDVLSAGALEQAALIKRRALSSEELVRLYLARIERHDPRLNAFVSTFPRRALAAAREKDAAVRRGEPLPAFHGVPIGIKDLNLVRF